MITAGRAQPSFAVSHELPDEAPAAYEKFDKRIDGYTKVILRAGWGWRGGETSTLPLMPMTLTPDVTVLDPTGESVRLSELAADRPVILAFLRHFG